MKKSFILLCLTFSLLSYSYVADARLMLVSDSITVQHDNETTEVETINASADSTTTDTDSTDPNKPKRKVIKNLEYYLFAGFFVVAGALYFFLRKKK